MVLEPIACVAIVLMLLPESDRRKVTLGIVLYSLILDQMPKMILVCRWLLRVVVEGPWLLCS